MTTMPMDVKSCSTCREVKPFRDFLKRSDSKDGYRDQCKLCREAKVAEWVAKRREHLSTLPPDITKQCKICKETKTLDKFHNSPNGKYGKRPMCAECVYDGRTPDRRVRKTEAEKRRRQREYDAKRVGTRRPEYLKRLYGISIDEFCDLLEKQGGRCAICGVEKCPSGQAFSVDHCHTTGKVRGILCKRCNIGIGMLQDKPEVVRKALNYLELSESSI